MIKASIIGGTGYGGSELLRLLFGHSEVEIVKVTSRTEMGKSVGEIHPNLYGLLDLEFSEEDLDEIADISDVVFLALPHGKAMERVPALLGKTKIIDLSGDYRLKDPKIFENHYGLAHKSPELLKRAVYGLTEFNREAIRGADLVACPGCFPTGVLLPLTPLAMENMLSGYVVIDAKTGSSGAGVSPKLTTHHPERAMDFKVYNVFSHRHQPEIEQELARFNSTPFDITFTPHSAPMVRGIFTTAYIFLEEEIGEERLREIYEDYYDKEYFIRIVEQARCAVVAGSNFCDIELHCRGNKVIVASAIDNLVKGAGGQGIQNMNLIFGFEERTGLTFPGTHP